MTKTKAGRITSGFREVQTTPSASLPPHMEHLRPKRRERAAQPSRAVRGARVNETVAFVHSLSTPARKQPGRRYGPAPKNPPHEGMQAPKPMDIDERLGHYFDEHGHMTLRQERQVSRMSWRQLYRDEGQVDAIEAWPAFNGKGRPTPKRKAVANHG